MPTTTWDREEVGNKKLHFLKTRFCQKAGSMIAVPMLATIQITRFSMFLKSNQRVN